MKTIGLLGGMGWEGTELYYRLLNEAVRDRLGGLHSARCVLLSVDFAEIEGLQAASEWERAGELLAADARVLEAAGAELVLLCSTTMHKVAPALTAALTVPLLHPGDVTADAVTRAGLHRVGVLGSAVTMEQPFFTDRLADRGLHVPVPDPIDRALVHRIIDEESAGTAREDSRRAVLAVIERLVGDEDAEGVVLACAALELLVEPDDVEVPVFSTTRLHAEAAVAAALA